MTGETTLEEARARLREKWLEGAECPCCRQFVKRYRRKLNSAMAMFVIALYREHQRVGFRTWVHGTEILRERASDPGRGKLAWWGLVEEMPNPDDESKKTSGLWRLTVDGRAFACARLRVASHSLSYNGECLGLEGDLIDIHQALGRKFNYAELMERL